MNIHDISKNIVIKFLEEYYLNLVYHNNYYDILSDIILSGNVESAPDEIVNWIITNNHLNDENIKIKTISNCFNKFNIFWLL